MVINCSLKEIAAHYLFYGQDEHFFYIWYISSIDAITTCLNGDLNPTENQSFDIVNRIWANCFILITFFGSCTVCICVWGWVVRCEYKHCCHYWINPFLFHFNVEINEARNPKKQQFHRCNKTTKLSNTKLPWSGVSRRDELLNWKTLCFWFNLLIVVFILSEYHR